MKTNKESLDKFTDKAIFYGCLAWLEESYRSAELANTVAVFVVSTF